MNKIEENCIYKPVWYLEMPDHNIHTKHSVIMYVPILDCICIFCGYKFAHRRTTAREFLREYIRGDFYERCGYAGGIMRLRDIDLARLARIRYEIFEIINLNNARAMTEPAMFLEDENSPPAKTYENRGISAK